MWVELMRRLAHNRHPVLNTEVVRLPPSAPICYRLQLSAFRNYGAKKKEDAKKKFCYVANVQEIMLQIRAKGRPQQPGEKRSFEIDFKKIECCGR